MYRLCTTEKSAHQQLLLEQCLLETMLATPFHEITISGLCERACLSRKTFYRLFDRKEDVLEALIDQALLDAETYQPDPSVKKGSLHRFFAYWKSRHQLMEALIRNNMYSLLWERAILLTMRESPDVLSVFTTQEDEFMRETVIFYISGLFVLIMDWHAEGYKRSIDEMSTFVMHLMTTAPAKGPLKTDPYSHYGAWENGVYHPEHEKKDLP